MQRRISVVLSSLLSLSSATLLASQEFVSTLENQTGLAVTIYNDNLALIRDQREVTLTEKNMALAFREISGQILPETALLRSLTASSDIHVIEQNFDFDLLSAEKLLDKYLGHEIGVIKTHPTTGEEHTEYGTLLSTHQGPIIKFGDRIETGLHGRFVFPRIPGNLRDKPTLIMQLSNPATKTPHTLELSYLTEGLQWKADYVMSLNQDDTSMNLNGWVTLTNTSGSSYPSAQLQLVAGNINRSRSNADDMMVLESTVMFSRSAPPPMAQESLFEYHLYTLAHKTTLANNQTKQVALLSAANVPVKKELRLFGNEHYYYSRNGNLGDKLPVDVFISFINNEKSHLGMPLPKGIIRAYKTDTKGNAQFIGENDITHTAKNDTLKIKLGSAFDVTATKKQTTFRKVSPHISESEYQIILRNGKSQPVSVNVIEPIPGDWSILSESSKHEKSSSTTASWHITIPAESETELTYRVQIK